MQKPSEKRDRLIGRLLILIGALMWSTSGIFARAPVFADWPLEAQGPILAFWRTTFGALIIMPTIRRPSWHWLLIPLGLCFALMNLTYLTAMVRTSPANAVWLQNAAPFWVFLICLFIFREKVSRLDIVSMAFGLTGVGVILACELTRSTEYDTLGLSCGVIAGITYGAILTLLNRLKLLDSSWICVLMQLAASLCLLPWILMLDVRPTWIQMAVLAVFGAFQLGIPYLLVTRGLRYVSAMEGVTIGLIEPVVMPIWVYLLWGITTPWWTLLGGSLILAGLMLRYFVLRDPTESEDP